MLTGKKSHSILYFFLLLLCSFSPYFCYANWEKDKDYPITILHTNDHHGRFWHNAQGEYGLAAQKTLLDRLRQEIQQQGGSVLLLSGGDINTGVPESDLQYAEPDFKGMSLLGYDAMAIGNHEFDHPIEILRKQQQWSSFPLLSANIYYKKNQQRVFPAYHMFNLQGLKVAVIGLTTDDTPILTNAKNVRDFDFRSPITEAQSLIPVIKQQEQPDIMLAVTHMGHYDDGRHGSRAPGDVELARALPRNSLDIIIGGHSQNPVCMVEKNKKQTDYVPGTPCIPDRQNGIWIVQAHEWGKYVGRADFIFRNGILSLQHYELIPVNLVKEELAEDGQKQYRYYTEEITRDPEIVKFLEPYQQKGLQYSSLKLGYLNKTMLGEREISRTQQSALGKLLGKIIIERVNADFVVFGGGTIRDSLYAGEITYGDILRVLPYFNTVVFTSMTGKEIITYLQSVANKPKGSGGYPQFTQITFTQKGNTLSNIRIKGEPLNLDRDYRMATLSFFASGGDGYPIITDKVGFIDSGYIANQLVRQYIQHHSHINADDFTP